MADNLESKLEQFMSEDGTVAPKPEAFVPTYRMIGDKKIPISKNMGPVWKSRVAAGTSSMKRFIERWEQVERYFYNDQQNHRQDKDDQAGNTAVGIQKTKRWSETENVVYSNFMAMVPALFAKNPQLEITSISTKVEQVQDAVRAGEMLANALASKKTAPGINFRPKGKRAILHGLAYNEAWLYVGYVAKDESSDMVLETLNKLSEEYADDKTTQERLKEIEGELMALEESSDFFAPAGPEMKLIHPRDVIIDENSVEDDLSDAKWIGLRVFMHTGYLRAKYFQKDDVANQWISIYEPTHIMQGDQSEQDQAVRPTDNLYKKLLDGNKSYADYGFSDEASYRRAQYTECIQVWDRITRRMLLFNAKQWQWPIWVWDDPCQFDGFFPIDKLALTADLRFNRGRGEATYYLDQQDSINEINSEIQHCRTRMRHKIFYNKNIIKTQADLDNYLSSDTLNAFGVDLKEGMKWEDAIFAPGAPSLAIKELFNKEGLYQAIDRIGNYSAIMRGNEFKTNTTNQAIETYNSISTQKIDEKIDAVEEWIGDALTKVLHVCVKFMPDEQVQALIGEERMPHWQTFKELYNSNAITMRTVGGSTQKPTSAAKKKEAMSMAQILGQFASATPYALVITLKLMEQAFDEIDMEAEDWKELRQSIEMQLQRGNSSANGAPNNGGQPGNPQEEAAEGEPASPDQHIQKIVDAAVARGVPPNVAKQKVQQIVRADSTRQ